MTKVSAYRGLASVLLTAALVLTGVLPVRAAEYITLNQFSGHPAQHVEVSGGGYWGSEQVSIYVGPAVGRPAATAGTNAIGFFEPTRIQIPLESPPGNITITTVGVTSGLVSTNSYYVIPFTPTISVNASANTPGNMVSIDGNGFGPQERVMISLATASMMIDTDASGNFRGATLTIPTVEPRTYEIRAQGISSRASAMTWFYVGGFYPSLSPSTYFLLPGSRLAFSGSGWAPNEFLTVKNGQEQFASFYADGGGNFGNAGSFIVPLRYTNSVQTFIVNGATSGASTSVMITIGSFYSMASPSRYFILPGETLTFFGSGFHGNETVDVLDGTMRLGSFTVGADGSFGSVGNIIIPASYAGGVKTFTLRGRDSLSQALVSVAVGDFSPTLSPSSYYVTPGSSIQFEGRGFAPSETVAIKIGTSTLGTVAADGGGNFATESFTIPFALGSQITYSASGQVSGVEATAAITISLLYPDATADTYYARPGTIVQVTGNGFAPGETVSFSVGSTTIGSIADSNGRTNSVSLPLPYGLNGTATITLVGLSSGAEARLPITLSSFMANVTPSHWWTTPGTPITFSGTGFAPQESINITNGHSSLSVSSDNSGSFAASSTIPHSARNSITYSFRGALSNESRSVTIGLGDLHAYVGLSTYYATGGSPLTVTGVGFGPTEPISIDFGGIALSGASSDNAGNLNFSTTVPFGMPGEKIVRGTGALSGASNTTTFTQAPIYTSTFLGEYAAAPGNTITFIGSGFLPQEPIEIRTDRTGSTTVHAFMADATGNFRDANYTLPEDFTEGLLKLIITGTQSMTTASILYYVTGS